MTELGEEPSEYSIAHIKEALAADPHTAELHVEVQVKGSSVAVTGRVTTDERRNAVEEVIGRLYPGARIQNYIAVEVLDTEPTVEDLS